MRRLAEISRPHLDRKYVGRTVGTVDLKLRIRRPALEKLDGGTIGDDERLALEPVALPPFPMVVPRHFVDFALRTLEAVALGLADALSEIRVPLSVARRPHDLAVREHFGLQKRLVLDDVVGRRIVGDSDDVQPIVALARNARKIPLVHPEPSVRTARRTIRGELAVYEDLEYRATREPQLERHLAVPLEMRREGNGRVDLAFLRRRPDRLGYVKPDSKRGACEHRAHQRRHQFQSNKCIHAYFRSYLIQV